MDIKMNPTRLLVLSMSIIAFSSAMDNANAIMFDYQNTTGDHLKPAAINYTISYISIRNNSDFTVSITMDNNREAHTILAHHSTVFHPHVGDAPIFRVSKVENGKPAGTLFGRKIGPVGLNGSFGFDGNRLIQLNVGGIL